MAKTSLGVQIFALVLSAYLIQVASAANCSYYSDYPTNSVIAYTTCSGYCCSTSTLTSLSKTCCSSSLLWIIGVVLGTLLLCGLIGLAIAVTLCLLGIACQCLECLICWGPRAAGPGFGRRRRGSFGPGPPPPPPMY